MKPTILVVEDEEDVLDLIVYNLKKSGYHTASATDGATGLRRARDLLPDLVILDLMLPTLDGIDVCKQLKAGSTTAQLPIIMLTARAEEIDRIVGLELGADDYVTKPFSPRELMLRVKSILRRSAPQTSPQDTLQIGDLTVDRAKHVAEVKSKPLDLTATEFRLLTTLMERHGRVQTRERLLKDVWDYAADTDTRTVDTHVKRLREKLGRSADLIETVRGVGYRFADEPRRKSKPK